MKMTVLYHSQTGHTKEMAEAVVRGMALVEGARPKAFSLEDYDENWVRESRCVVMGTPIYMASVSGRVKAWLEGPALKCALAGKLGGAFATADYVHGGGELGIRTILDHMMTMGMLAYSGGSAYGKPIIHLGPVAVSGQLSSYQETFQLYGKRMALKAMELWKNQPL